MKRLDQFLIKSFAGPFLLTFLIVAFIFVMNTLWLYVDDLVGKGLGFWIILEFLFWGSVTMMPHALPLATLLASIMTLGNLGENNELLAMKAAGISLQRILAPLVVVAICISIGAFYVSNNLIPVAYNKIYTLQYDIGKTKEEIKIPTGTFYNGIEGFTLRISEHNKKTDMMYDVMVYDHKDREGNISVAVADSGLIKSNYDKTALVFILFDGISYEEDNTRKYKDTSYVVNRIQFKRQEVIIPLENYTFQKSEGDRYGNEIMAQDLKELRHDRDSISEIYAKTHEKQKERYGIGNGTSFGYQLDSLKGKHITQPYPLDSVYEWKSLREEYRNVSIAAKNLNSNISVLESFDNEIYPYARSLRRINLESFRKFTLSFACLIFFFIGAPMGAIIRKGGLGTPVIISALFFVIYWVVDISGKKLARDGVISPMFGAFISTLVLLPIGVFLTIKSTKDSSLFNVETYLNAIKKFFKDTLPLWLSAIWKICKKKA